MLLAKYVAALLLATGTAHADKLPRSVDGLYCWQSLDDNRVHYMRIDENAPCAGSGNSAYIDGIHYANGRGIECKFVKVKKILKTVYQVRNRCTDPIRGPKRFFTEFKLELLSYGDFQITYNED